MSIYMDVMPESLTFNGEAIMPQQEPLVLIGAVPSPYTRKMVALLRYRNIAYQVIWGDPKEILQQKGIAAPKVGLLPTFLMPDENGQLQAITDSTPIIRRLEDEQVERRVVPSDPAMAFIDYLIEDFADEWCTKYMFHYRWYPEKDADNAGTLLPLFHRVDIADSPLNQFKAYITQRQVNRLGVVGSNEVTAPLIDASYRRFLVVMELHLQAQPFVLGQRPSACDFAIYGQLTQLIGFDPSSREIAHEIAPRVVAWTGLMEDQCGLDPAMDGWNSVDSIPQSLNGLLIEIGRVYAPTLLANAVALENGDKSWETEIDGSVWSQQSFPYQGKCLTWIRDEYFALSDADRSRIDALLEGTGCEVLFN